MALRLLVAVSAELKLVVARFHDLDSDDHSWIIDQDKDGTREEHVHVIEAVTGQPAAEARRSYLFERENLYLYIQRWSHGHSLRLSVPVSFL